MILGLAVLAIGAVVSAVGGSMAKSGYDARQKEDAAPKISIQRITAVWVKISDDAYQVGVVLKLFNLDSTALLLNGVRYSEVTFGGRGPPFHIQQFVNREPEDLRIEDNFLKANSEGQSAILLPTKMFSPDVQAPGPEIIFTGAWKLIFGNKVVSAMPELIGTYEGIVSKQEWERGSVDGTSLKALTAQYRRPPNVTAFQGTPAHFYLMFNADRSATIDEYEIDKTNPVIGPSGVMFFIATHGKPPSANGWVTLGETYSEVWADPKKRALYDALFPPGSDGKPRPLGYFSGQEALMDGTTTP